jgi:putative heme transporter
VSAHRGDHLDGRSGDGAWVPLSPPPAGGGAPSVGPAGPPGGSGPGASAGSVGGGPQSGPVDRVAGATDEAVRYGLRVAAGYAWRVIVVAAAVYLLFVVLARLRFVAVAVFVGLVFCALLRPTTDLFARVLPRGLAVAGSMLLALAVLAGVFTFIGASVAGQSATLSAQFSHGLADIGRSLEGPPFHLPATDLPRIADQARAWIGEHQGALAGRILGGAGVALELFTGLALAVFCSIFFLNSGDRMWTWFLTQLPGDQARWDGVARAGWATFASYTRGVVLVAATNAALVCVVLLLLKVPLALPLSLLVFFAAFIPLIGSPIALAVATVVALAARGPLIALAVLALIVVVGQIEGHILHPLVMGHAVNLHPVAIALTVACGTVLAGVIGAVVAVPLAAVAWSVLKQLRTTQHPARHTSATPTGAHPPDGAGSQTQPP